MKQLFLSLIITAACFFLVSCDKHLYIMDGKEVKKLSREASEQNLKSFVVYLNGDTIKGTTLKRRSNPVNQNEKWIMDGKVIPSRKVNYFQDADGFWDGSNIRLLKHPKISMFMNQSSGITTFPLTYKGEYRNCTFTFLKETMKDCPAAMNQIDTEFKGGVWQKNPEYLINDYRALIRIINIFTKCE